MSVLTSGLGAKVSDSAAEDSGFKTGQGCGTSNGAGSEAALEMDLLAGLTNHFKVYGEKSDDERNARFHHTRSHFIFNATKRN